jgi:hypothetical protein
VEAAWGLAASWLGREKANAEAALSIRILQVGHFHFLNFQNSKTILGCGIAPHPHSNNEGDNNREDRGPAAGVLPRVQGCV